MKKRRLVYGDHCLLTSDRNIMADVNRIFTYLENPKTREQYLKACKTLIVSPMHMRRLMNIFINKEIKAAKHKKDSFHYFKIKFTQ